MTEGLGRIGLTEGLVVEDAVTVGVKVWDPVPDPDIVWDPVPEPLFVFEGVTVGVRLRLQAVPETVCVEERVAVLLRLAVKEGV